MATNASTPEPDKIAKWQRWEARISDEIIDLLGVRKIFTDYRQLIEGTVLDAEGAIFHRWAIDGYVTQVAMAIRRQADFDSHSVSLARLITDIRNNPQALTRTWHATLYGGVSINTADQDFSKYAGGGSHFDPNIASNDLADLSRTSSHIADFATRSMAHASTRPLPKVTFQEVEVSINILRDIAQKYKLLLTGHFNYMEPLVDQSWTVIFADPGKSR